MREKELTNRRVERKPVRALSGRVDEHRARAVEDVPGGNLPASLLEEVRKLAVLGLGGLLHDREDRSDRHVDIDVRRSVERIEQQAVLSAAKTLGDRDDVWLLLRCH